MASTALFNVAPQDTGAASAVLNTAQQIGGSFGTAIQNTIVVSSATAFWSPREVAPLSSRRPTAPSGAAHVHGYDIRSASVSLMLLLAPLHFFALVNIDRHHLGQHDEVASPLSRSRRGSGDIRCRSTYRARGGSRRSAP